MALEDPELDCHTDSPQAQVQYDSSTKEIMSHEEEDGIDDADILFVEPPHLRRHSIRPAQCAALRGHRPHVQRVLSRLRGSSDCHGGSAMGPLHA